MISFLVQWLDAHASPAWRQWHLLHSSWVAMFWCAFYGMVLSLDAFTGTAMVQSHPFVFMGICMMATLTWGIARMTKQPGTHDVE